MGFLDHECQGFVSAGMISLPYLAALQSSCVSRMNNVIKAHLCVHNYYLPGKLLWQILYRLLDLQVLVSCFSRNQGTDTSMETLGHGGIVCVLPNRCSPYGKDFCKCLQVFICRSVFVTAFCSGQVLRVLKCLRTAKWNFVCGHLHHSWGRKPLIIKDCIPLKSKWPACSVALHDRLVNSSWR